MPIAAGTKLGRYEIRSKIGEGGMGEVYLAEDTKLDRQVAIKALPEHLFSDTDRLARFQREAKVLASLNHSNIGAIYGIEEANSQQYLVLEYIEGETLDERLSRGPLPIDEAIEIAVHVANALEAAHEKGVIHRDLKPGNIMVTPDGKVKVLDFGLARTETTTSMSAPTDEDSPTKHLPVRSPSPTIPGAIMGTAGYMSPEQVRGKVVDKRSDIFSFACVLYEMLTGVQAFRGDTVADSIGATLHKEHDQSLLPANTPANVKRLLHRCLAKNRQERLRDIGDARIELVATEPSDNSSSPSVSKMHLAMAAAAVLVAVALTFGIAYLVFPRQNPLNLRAAINLPAGFRLDNVNSSLALSSDGTILAFTATGTDGLQRLWIRSMNGLESQALTGTDDASYPFWSPDGQSLGFFSRHKLKTIELGTGTVRALCDAPNGRGGSWGGRGIIVFAPDYQTGLFTIPASGGTPVQVTTLKEENETHRHPFFLADGRHVLFVRALPSVNKSDGIYWLDLDNGRTAKVVDSSSQALYANGYLIFERGTALMAQPFDMKALQATGQAVIVAEDVQSNSGRYLGEFSLSQAGMLVYVTGSQYSVSRLTIYGEDGNKLSDIGQPAIFSELIQISPDGRKIAAAVARPDGIFDIWIFDVNGGNGRRLTFAADGRTAPVWSRDNSRLLFQDLKGQLYEQPQDGSTPERKLKIQFKNRNDFITSLSADGEFLSVVSQTKGGLDVVIVPLKGGEPKPYATTPAWETEPTFSPDGKWLAYVSDETGRYEVFVVPVPGGQGKFQVSSNGGQSPVWINGGHELAYVNDQRKLVAVELRSSGMQMETGGTRMLFGGQTLPVFPGVEAGSAGGSPVYISPDGKRVVIAVPTNLSSETPLNLITNWTGNLGLK